MPKELKKSKKDFWLRRTPCWELMQCAEAICNGCPACIYREYPCWEIEGTYCKWDSWGSLGKDTSICKVCKVYLKFGKGQSIQLKLFGRGIKLLFKP